MRFVWIIKRDIYNNKMSRVRFHGVGALKRHPGVWLKKTGPGWENFSMTRIINFHKPDFVIWYKPLNINYRPIINAKIPTILRYNEMWDKKWTKHEITTSKTNIVICHHKNDMDNYRDIHGVYFANNPHCAEKTIFKDYGEKKIYDVLFVGVISKKIYPLRTRIKERVLPKLRKMGFNCKIFEHPGYNIKDVNTQVIKYAREINKAKIVITCSSKFKYALAKYVEIPMCNAVLCGDVPNENQEWYRKWMLCINMDHSPDKIADIIRVCLKDEKGLRQMSRLGMEENLKCRTQEHYAARMMEICNDYRTYASKK